LGNYQELETLIITKFRENVTKDLVSDAKSQREGRRNRIGLHVRVTLHFVK